MSQPGESDFDKIMDDIRARSDAEFPAVMDDIRARVEARRSGQAPGA